MLFDILLIYAAYTDYTRREIPNGVIFGMYIAAVFSNIPITERIAGFLIPAVPLFFIALKNEGVKGGDVKFLSAAGAYAGLSNLALILIPTTIAALVRGQTRAEKSVPLAYVFAVGYFIFKIIMFLKGG